MKRKILSVAAVFLITACGTSVKDSGQKIEPIVQASKPEKKVELKAETAKTPAVLAKPKAKAKTDYEKRLDVFKAQLIKDKDKYGLEKEFIQTAFKTIQLKDKKKVEKIIKSDKNQSEFNNTYTKYVNRYASDLSISIGQKKKKEHKDLLAKMEKKYNVPSNYLLAFWRAESSYGSFMGNQHLLTATATLMLEGRREEFFKKQLIAALQIMQEQKMDPATVKGSWAGGMGNFQFIPTTFQSYAKDENGDGKIDVFKDLEDAFGSAGNYLSSMGWNKDERWGREVKLTEKIESNLINNRKLKHSVNQWSKWGVKKANGQDLPVSNVKGSLIKVQDTNSENKLYTRYFLVYKNFDIIMNWNRSYLYALSIGELSDKLK